MYSGSGHRLHPPQNCRRPACSSCLEPLAQTEKPAFHCDQCCYTVCQTCEKPKSHPVHPNHDLYFITPTSQWKCKVCKRDSTNIKEKQCYNCSQCDFHVCKSCYADVKSPAHHQEHALRRTDVSLVYQHTEGGWACDVCDEKSAPGNVYPLHCSSCEFDICDSCIEPYISTSHPGHVFYRADSNITYGEHKGEWRCDKCKQVFIPDINHFPFHCSVCIDGYDLCGQCMKVSNEGTNKTRSPHYAPVTQEQGKPITAPSDAATTQTGLSGPPDENDLCPKCFKEPKDAGILHGDSVHVFCCLKCAQELHKRKVGCPSCSGGSQIFRSPKYAKRTKKYGMPITSPSDPGTTQTGLSGPPDETDLCPKCSERPKNAGILHGDSVHVCCCLPCAQDFHERRVGCPICSLEIERVFEIFFS